MKILDKTRNLKGYKLGRKTRRRNKEGRTEVRTERWTEGRGPRQKEGRRNLRKRNNINKTGGRKN